MKSTKCVACGFVGFSDETCKACGAPLNQRSTNTPPVAPPPAYGAQYNSGPQYGSGAQYNSGSQYGSWDQPEGEKKGMAIAALVLGILSFFTFGIIGIGAITGIILACVAMGKAKREPWKYGGRGMAIAGLALCVTSLVMVVPIGIVASIAIPNLLAARRAANEASAISSVRTIVEAEAVYQSAFKKFGTLEELAANNLLDSPLSTGERSGYRFSVSVTGPDSFEVNAMPTAYRSSGMRSFYTDETAVIRAGDNFGGPSSKADEPLDFDYPSRRDRRADYRDRY